MVDDSHSGPKGSLSRPLQTRPRHQRIDHASSRTRADNAATYREPSDVSVIKSRLKDALAREVEVKRLADVFPPKAQPKAVSKPDPVDAKPAPLKVAPLPKADPIPEKNVENTAPASLQDDADAKPIMNENGFQIFKPQRAGDDAETSAPIKSAAADDDLINKEADPVPMGADAIEEALRLINDEDHDEDAPSDNTADDIGFIPANIHPGTFGAEPDTDQPSNAPSSPDTPNVAPNVATNDTSDDEQLIDDILSGAQNADQAVSHHDNTASDVTADQHSASLHVLSSGDDISAKDKIHNLQIGQAMASSIRNIVKDEVDTALDQMARQAVREVLAHYR